MRERRRRFAGIALVCVVLLGGCAPSGDGAQGGATTTTSSPRPSGSKGGVGTAFVDGRFTSTEGGFSVALPKAPREVRQQEKVGDVTLRVVIYDVAISDTEAYQVSFVDYPESVGGLDPSRVLDGAVEGAVSRTNGSLERRDVAELAGLEARDAEIGAALPIFLRVALSGRRLFTLQQIGPAERTPTYDRLLGSFRLED